MFSSFLAVPGKIIMQWNSMANGTLKLLWKAVFSLGVLAIIFHSIPFQEVLQTWLSFPFLWLLVILPIFLFDRLVMSWKWTFLLFPLSIRPSQLTAFRIYYTSSFLGYVIPLGIGPDVVRFFKMKKEGHQSGKVLASILVERLLGIISNILVLIFSIVLLLWLAFRVDFVRDVALVAMIFAGLALMGMALLFWGKSWAWLSRQKFLATWKVKFGCAEIETSLMQLRNAKGTLLFFTVISFLEQFLPVTVVYFIAKAVQIPLSLAGCVAFVPISIFLQRLPLSFMGLGVREGSYVLFLYFLGIDAGMAVGLGMLVFAIETLSLLPAAIWLLIDWIMTGEMPA